MSQATIPFEISDPVNQAILSVSEDRVQGFHVEPFDEIARQSGVLVETVIERIRAMLRAGTIRRVRQTLLAMNLAPGALVAWRVPDDRLGEAFDWLFAHDPFSGHVVIRTTDHDADSSGRYRLWTTLKVPLGYSMHKHCGYLAGRIGADRFILMPARKLFVLGVGHMRRRKLQPGDKSEQPAQPQEIGVVELSELDWRVLTALKREFTLEEIGRSPWPSRAAEAGVSFQEFVSVSMSLARRGVIGRFSTFLEHAKPLADGDRVTRFNGLFHWAVPPGREVEAGREVGRHLCMTHAYWREGGPEFHHVNIMGVAHGTEKTLVLAHKAAIDAHLASVGIPVLYTNVFWGGRSEIKPSEITPAMYLQWCGQQGLDPATMRD